MFFSPDSLKMFSCHIPFLSCASPIHTCVYCVMHMKLIYIFQVSAYAGTTPRWIYIGAIKDPRVEIKSCCGQMPMPPGTWCQPAIYRTSTASIADARQIPIELMLQSRQVLTILVVTRSIYRWFNARKT